MYNQKMQKVRYGRYGGSALALALLAAAYPTTAAAQEIASGEVADTDASGRDEIVVTARKRDERLQDVPIAVSAATGEMLERMNITDVTRLDSITPGLNVSQAAGFVSYFLRGVGSSTTIPGVENAIATYVDGVYVARPTSALQQLQNIDRVEVLRGPQGTLFGRNATGGLINIITKKPSDRFIAKAALSYGNADTIEGSAYMSGGIAEGVSVGLSAAGRYQGDGYGRNLIDGSDAYDSRYLNVRGQLRIEASPTLEALLSAYFSDTRTTASQANSVAPGSIPATAVGGLLLDGTPVGPARYSTEPRTGYYNHLGFIRIQDYGASLTLTKDWDNISLTSISAWSKSRGFFDNTDFDLTDAIGWAVAINPQGVNTANPTLNFASNYEFPYFYSQELRLGSTGGAPFQWTLGLYAQGNEDAYDPIRIYFASDVQTKWSDRNRFAIPGFAQGIVGKVKNQAYAAFAQGTYSITDQWDITAGIRYNYETKKFLGQFYNFNAAGDTATLALERQAKETWQRPTWLLSTAYKFSDSAMGYLSYNRGFRSGVFNTSSPTSTTPVKEEVIDAYEVGFKTEWFDRRLRVNGSAYYYDYRNLQFLIISPTTGTALLTNAAGARIQGVDLEVATSPIEGVDLWANLSVIDSKYTKFPGFAARIPQVDAFGNPTGGLVTQPVNAEGNRLAQTPPYTLTLGGNFKTPIGDNGVELELTTDVTFKGKAFQNPEHTIAQPAYGWWNASLGLRIPDGPRSYRISLWGRNLTDNDVIISGGALFNALRTTYAEPLTYGLRFAVEM